MKLKQLMGSNDAQYVGLLVLIIGLFMVLHSWQLALIPQGLYVDETSVGHNAALIAKTGIDEHGERLPLFFKAFGEYKNPVYIYTTAILFYFFGPSVWLLRFTSVLYFTLFLSTFTLLAHRVFRQKNITLFLLLSAGTLPWFFPLSRMSFEGMVAQLALSACGLVCVHYAWHSPLRSRNSTLLAAVAAGLFWGLSAYTYSTARLLSFAWAGMVILIYARRATLERSVGFVAAFGCVLLPFIGYGLQHPGALTYRFRIISYVYDASLSVGEKVHSFMVMYLRHFSPEFLVQVGDANLRHNTGYGGVIFKVIFGLGILGLYVVIKDQKVWWQDRFRMLILALLFISPSAAALTTGDSGQALRGLLMGLIILVIAGYGLAWIQQSPHWVSIMGVLLLVLAFEATGYLYHYFTVYPATTRLWFETYGLEPAFEEVVRRRPTHITFEPNVHQVATNVAFYAHVIPGLSTIPRSFEWPRGEVGTCAISWYVPPPRRAPVEVAIPNSPVKVHCY